MADFMSEPMVLVRLKKSVIAGDQRRIARMI